MNKKLLVCAMAFAGMALAAGKTYEVRIFSPAMIGKTELKPGDYKLQVEDNKVVIKGAGKVQKEADVKVESADTKFPNTTVRMGSGEKPQIQEIRIGGTNTKLVFTGETTAAGM